MKPAFVLQAAASYLGAHPEELLRFLKNALELRVGVPLQALRWWAGQSNGKRAPKDLEIEARPPGLFVAASFELMATPLRASAVIFVDSVEIKSDALLVALRLAEVKLEVLDPGSETPIAALLRSGALDLSKPGNLAAYMPKRPAVLVDAKDDRIVLDLLRHPKLGNQRVRRVLELLSPVCAVRGIATDVEHVDLALQPFPQGLSEALSAVRDIL